MTPTVPKLILRGALALSALALVATEARASTAANTQITNTATVTYRDAGNNPQPPVTASAVVTVTLAPSPVTLSSPPNQPLAQGTSATLTYTITSNANGPDTYTLASGAVASNMSTVTPTLPANVTLGGTTLAAPANDTNTSITVPYDGTADGVVNGIAQNDVVVLNGNAYGVSGISENPGANTTTITLASAITGGTVAAGQIVGERQTFDVVVPSGTITAGGQGTQTVTTRATSATDGNQVTSQNPATVITVNRPTLTVTKLVSVDDGANFGATGSAVPATSLIYKITVTNTGATAASAVTFADAIPAYLSYVAGSARTATASATAYTAATTLTDDGADADGYAFSAASVSYVPGGSLAGGAVLVLFYRATIN